MSQSKRLKKYEQRQSLTELTKRSIKRLKSIGSTFTGELEQRGLILIHTEQKTEVGMQVAVFIVPANPSHTLLKN